MSAASLSPGAETATACAPGQALLGPLPCPAILQCPAFLLSIQSARGEAWTVSEPVGHTSSSAFRNSLKLYLTSSHPLVLWPHLPCVLSLPPGLCPSLELMSPGCLSGELKGSYDFITYSACSFYWGRNDRFCSFLNPKQMQIPIPITNTIGL